jgi:hypothetical protein
MLRRCLSAALVLVLTGGFLFAGTYNGATIVKIDGDKVTVRMRPAARGEKATEKTFKLSKDAKFVKKMGEEETEVKLAAVKEMVTKAAKAAEAAKDDAGTGRGGRGRGNRNAVRGVITTTGEGDAETITKVTLGGGGRGRRPMRDSK